MLADLLIIPTEGGFIYFIVSLMTLIIVESIAFEPDVLTIFISLIFPEESILISALAILLEGKSLTKLLKK